MAPGVYLRSLLIGYFEGLDSERGIAWRAAISLSLRKFLGFGLDEMTPDHSTISRTRRWYWLERHKAVFRWVLKILSEEGLISGRTVSIDATTREANAVLRSIVRRLASFTRASTAATLERAWDRRWREQDLTEACDIRIGRYTGINI